VVTGVGSTAVVNAPISGGAGGAGGNAPIFFGGNGGSGGTGLLILNSGSFTINAGVAGGSGGSRGVSSGSVIFNGADGLGGVGIIGSQLDLTIGASGTVTGGLSGDGVTRADAVRVTGGSNSITFLGTTSGLLGDIGNFGDDLTLRTTGSVTVANRITGTGRLVMPGPGTVTLSAANTYSGGTTVQGGVTHITGMGALGTGRVDFSDGRLNSVVTGTFSNDILIVSSSSGAISASTGETLTLTGSISAGSSSLRLGHATDNGTIILNPSSVTMSDTFLFLDGGTVRLGSNGALVTDGATTLIDIAAGATLDINGPARVHNLQGSGTITNDSGAAASLIVNNSTASTFSGVVRDGLSRTSLTKTGADVLTLSGANSYSGATSITDGTLRAGAINSLSSASAFTVGTGTTLDLAGFNQTIGSLAGTGAVTLGAATLTAGGDGSSTSYSGVLSGSGSLTKAGAGTLTLAGINSYSGATSVTGGTLLVNGSILSSSGVTVGAGASIGGSGTLPSLTVNGTLAPGNSPGTLTVNGNLVLGAGSLYLAEVEGAVSDRVNVTGTAALAGTLRIVPLGGAYLFGNPYTLLAAAGGLGGTRFGTVDTSASFGDGITSTVSYTGTDVQLVLTPKPLTPIVVAPVTPTTPSFGLAAPRNAAAVAAGIDAAVAAGANPSALFAIYNLPAAAIPGAVNQLSGEVHTAAPAMANSAAGQFLGTMLDGSGAGRLAGTRGGPSGTAGFTADLPSRQDGPGRASFDPARFSLWGATFGSTGRNDGDRATGSASRNLSDGHVAVGADIRLGSNTVAGIAVAGGQSRASLSGGLGKAEADVFQAGLYGHTMIGTLNVGAALGYSRLDTDTTRAIPALGRSGVTASYATQAWSGRIEASLPVATWHGITLSPLAAFQAVRASSPAAIERDASGLVAGTLTLGRRSDMTSRSELGMQVDANLTIGATPVTGFVRAAWAHYYQRDADLAASINGLPGARFSVTGARPDRNAALIAAGLDVKLSRNVSLGARIDGEMSESTRRIGGTAQLRVSF
jgi:autotransporter-associated beta strand protein